MPFQEISNGIDILPITPDDGELVLMRNRDRDILLPDFNGFEAWHHVAHKRLHVRIKGKDLDVLF